MDILIEGILPLAFALLANISVFCIASPHSQVISYQSMSSPTAFCQLTFLKTPDEPIKNKFSLDNISFVNLDYTVGTATISQPVNFFPIYSKSDSNGTITSSNNSF